MRARGQLQPGPPCGAARHREADADVEIGREAFRYRVHRRHPMVTQVVLGAGAPAPTTAIVRPLVTLRTVAEWG